MRNWIWSFNKELKFNWQNLALHFSVAIKGKIDKAERAFRFLGFLNASQGRLCDDDSSAPT